MKNIILTTILASASLSWGALDQANANTSAAAVGQQPMAHMNHQMPAGPFSSIEMRMSERMMAAVGANASETWVRKMIEHHHGSIEMSQLVVQRGGPAPFLRMARETIMKQQRDIAELQQMLNRSIRGGSGQPNPYMPAEQRMHHAMMLAMDSNLARTWARKMIPHHQGAIDMVDTLERQGNADPQVLAMARRTAADQRRDISQLEMMLGRARAPARRGHH